VSESSPPITLVPVSRLVHIEGYSDKRVAWLMQKIVEEGVWTKPLALDDRHGLVLDGQHRMEVALRLGLLHVPAVAVAYATVAVWSLRPNHAFDWERVTERALAGKPYPYKTVKHRFPFALPPCAIPLSELRDG
jgi:hypothetical protein